MGHSAFKDLDKLTLTAIILETKNLIVETFLTR